MPDELTEVQAGHVRRVARLDPIVRVPDLDLGRDHTVCWSPDRTAAAVVDDEITDPTSEAGLWVDDHVVRIQLRCSTDDVGGVADLLQRAHRSRGGSRPTYLSVAARDATLVRPLLMAGFAPTGVLAGRRLDAAEEEPVPGVRAAGPDDVDALVDALVAVQALDSRTGAIPERPDSGRVVRPGIERALRERPGWTWVAEREGRVVGSCQLEPPEDADWVASAVTEPHPAYLGCLHVDPDERGTGVGWRLVRAAHRQAALAGVTTVLVHHSATSPLSVPFWGRAGYRPLFTSWARFG